MAGLAVAQVVLCVFVKIAILKTENMIVTGFYIRDKDRGGKVGLKKTHLVT